MDLAYEKMGTASSLVVSIVAHGLATGQSWPFVTVPAFQERASTIRKLSGALYFGINPIVRHDQREQWEYYSNHDDSAGWYQEGLEYQSKLGLDDLDIRRQVETDDPKLDLSSGVANFIYDYDRRNDSAKAHIAPPAEDYHPVWQVRNPIKDHATFNHDS